jgi:hypothetical protein
MDGSCRAYIEMRNAYRILVGNLKGRWTLVKTVMRLRVP